MKCRLCLEGRTLCKSHIVSEFNYKPMYDEKHRFMIVNADPDEKIRRLQKGLREKLLCEQCEGKVSAWEKYVREFLYGGKGFYTRKEGSRHYLEGLDYASLKLYFLSIIWRMSISSLEIFEGVNLGPHEEKLRKMLFDEKPGEPNEYGVICVAPLIEGELFKDWMLQPTWARSEGHRVYRILIGGLLYLFFVSSHSVPKELEDAFVTKEGKWVIVTEDVKRIPFIHQWFLEVAKANKED